MPAYTCMTRHFLSDRQPNQFIGSCTVEANSPMEAAEKRINQLGVNARSNSIGQVRVREVTRLHEPVGNGAWTVYNFMIGACGRRRVFTFFDEY